jgi:hypothetical protein
MSIKIKFFTLIRQIRQHIYTDISCLIYARECRDEIIKAKIPLTVRIITEKDIEEISSIYGVNLKEDILKRIKREDVGFCAEYDGKIIGHSWLALKTGSIIGVVNFNVPKEHVFVYEAFVLNDYRRLGVNREIATTQDQYLLNNGIKTRYSIVLLNNISSIKAGENLGSKNIGILNIKILLGIKKNIIKNCDEYNKSKIKKYFGL